MTNHLLFMDDMMLYRRCEQVLGSMIDVVQGNRKRRCVVLVLK